MTPALARLIAAFTLQLRRRHPFFATLALFADYREDATLPTAATDGRTVFLNPDFFATLSPPEAQGVLLHEVLHAALLHPLRRGTREPELWNLAADMVVNGMIDAECPDFRLPEGAVRDPAHAHLSVEELYALLLR